MNSPSPMVFHSNVPCRCASLLLMEKKIYARQDSFKRVSFFHPFFALFNLLSTTELNRERCPTLLRPGRGLRNVVLRSTVIYKLIFSRYSFHLHLFELDCGFCAGISVFLISCLLAWLHALTTSIDD